MRAIAESENYSGCTFGFAMTSNCESMDSLSCAILRLMDDLVKCKVEMENAMSEGFILMAKARMLMGKERVSMLQFPTNGDVSMISRYSVRREPTDDDLSCLVRQFISSVKLDNNVAEHLAKSESDMQVRHRKGEKKQPEADKDENESHCLKHEEQSSCFLQKNSEIDPLKWFGVLVPQELKLAQKAFEKSISLSVDCANIQCKIDHIREAYKKIKLGDKCA